jgi:hypothetical protein
MAGKTLFDKIWESHVVRAEPDGTTLLYIDRQLVHEVTSPQAFEGLKLAGRRPRRPAATLAVPDHNVPTTDRTLPIADLITIAVEVSCDCLKPLRKTVATLVVPTSAWMTSDKAWFTSSALNRDSRFPERRSCAEILIRRPTERLEP